MVCCLPTMRRTRVWIPGGEDPEVKKWQLPSILVRRIPWTGDPGGYSPGRKESDMTDAW